MLEPPLNMFMISQMIIHQAHSGTTLIFMVLVHFKLKEEWRVLLLYWIGLTITLSLPNSGSSSIVRL